MATENEDHNVISVYGNMSYLSWPNQLHPLHMFIL